MTHALFAYDGDSLHFDRAYAANMNLPFDKGWDKWVVMQVDTPDHFKKVFESTDFDEAAKYLDQKQPA